MNRVRCEAWRSPSRKAGSVSSVFPQCRIGGCNKPSNKSLTPRFEPLFSDSSFGFRPGRSAHDAVRAARGYLLDGKTWMVDIDLKAFFDHVNQDRLVRKLREQIGDPRVLSLIGRYLRAGLLRHGEVEVRLEKARRKAGH